MVREDSVKWPRSEDEVTLALFLLARGANIHEVGKHFDASGSRVARVLSEKVPDEYRAAVIARHRMKSTHGTRSRYEKLGCRCLPCVEANNAYMRGLRARKSPPRHGTLSAYQNHGCRCEPCRSVGRSSNREGRAKLRSGTWVAGHGTRFKAQSCGCVDCDWARNEAAKAAAHANSASLEVASRHGQQWTGAELEVLLERRADGGWMRTVTEAAHLLGRTRYAVMNKRAREHDPRVGRIAGNVLPPDEPR